MDVRFLLAIAIGPALALLWLFKKWDEKRPEPPGKIRNTVLLGVASCIPAAILERLESGVLGSGFTTALGHAPEAYIVAAMTEESIKLSVILIFIWRSTEFDEVMDGVLYTAASSLGFALLENVMYVFGATAKGGSIAGLFTGLVRALTAVPLHATASGIMGYFVGRAKFQKSGQALWILTGLAIAIFIHGTYDWAAMSGGSFGMMEPSEGVVFAVILAIPITCGIILRFLVLHALKLDDAMLGSQPRPLANATAHYPYAAPQAYGAPAPMPYGAPMQQQPYGAPVYAAPAAYGAPSPMAYGAPVGQPYGAPPPQPYGAPPAQPYGAPNHQPAVNHPYAPAAYSPPPYGTPPQPQQQQAYGPPTNHYAPPAYGAPAPAYAATQPQPPPGGRPPWGNGQGNG